MNTLKQTVKLIKAALKHKHLYSQKEVFYLKNSLREAKKKMRLHKSVHSLHENESTINNSNT